MTFLPNNLRVATPSDLEQITAIEQRCFKPHIAFPPEVLAAFSFNPKGCCLVEEHEGTIRGFIILRFFLRHRLAGIATIDIDPVHRRQGIGSKLLMAAEIVMRQKRIKWAKLEVSEGNEPAIELYKKAGYVILDYIPGYYGVEHNGSRNALVMGKRLG